MPPWRAVLALAAWVCVRASACGEMETCESRAGQPAFSPPRSAPPLTPDRRTRAGQLAAHSGSLLPAYIPVALEPPQLDYEPWPICVPQAGSVEFINTSEDDELSVHSIKVAGVHSKHFHVAALPLTTLPPGGRMAFSVVFLPNFPGRSNGTLLVQTSHGGFLYELTGVGMPSPYALSPIVGTVPHGGAAFAPLLGMQNPHDTAMRITEITTTVDFLHLHLPPMRSGITQADIWKIRPGEAQRIITLQFQPTTIGRYLAYVHVMTDFDMLIMPVDLTVIPAFVERVPEVCEAREKRGGVTERRGTQCD
jgi:hypothetical protein